MFFKTVFGIRVRLLKFFFFLSDNNLCVILQVVGLFLASVFLNIVRCASSSKQVGEKGATLGFTTPKKQNPAKQNMPSPLRRFDKDDHSPSVSGSKNSEKGSSLENRNNEEQGGICSTLKMSAMTYRATLLKTQGKKDKSDSKLKVHNDLPQGVSLEKGAVCSVKVRHGIKVDEVIGKLPSCLNTVELSEKVGSKKIKLEMIGSSAPREDREICASTADAVLKDGGERKARVCRELSEECCTDVQLRDAPLMKKAGSGDNDDVTKKRRKLGDSTIDAASDRFLVDNKQKIGGANKEGASRTPDRLAPMEFACFRNVNEISNIPACVGEPEKRSKSLSAPKDLDILLKQSTSGGEPARVADNTKPNRPACAQSEIPGQQDLEGGEISGTSQSQHSEELATDSEEAIRLQKVSENISLVNKVYAERYVKLVAYQAKESNEFKEERDEIEKEQLAALDKAHEFESALVCSLHKQDSVRLEKLKIVDQDFNKSKDIIKNHMDSEQKKLEFLHEAAKTEEKNLQKYWSQEAKSGRPVASFSTLPQSLCSNFKLETLQLNEQNPSKEPITDRTGSPGLNECPANFVQSTEPLPSVLSNGGTSVILPDVQFQLGGLKPSEQDPALDRTGSLGDSVMGDNVNSTCQSTDPLPYKQSNDGSSVPSVQFHLRDSERSEQGPSEEPITDRTGLLRLTEMGVAGSFGTVPGHEPVVMGTLTTRSENLVESTFQSIGSLRCNRSEDATVASDLSNQGLSRELIADPSGSLGPNEARVPEVSETIHGHEQVMGAAYTEQLPMSAPANLASEPLLSNSSSHDISVLSPAMNLELPTPMDSLPSEQSRMPTGPSVGSSTRVSDTRSMTTSRTPQAPLPQDPLCYELERIRKEKEQVVKIHDELKMGINSDYEKEREEIRQKYIKLHHDVDTAFAQKKVVYETNISKVSMNMMLAEVFRFKCSETTRAAGPLGSQQGGHPGSLHNHQSFHSPSHQNSQRSPLVSSAAISATPSTTVQQVTRHSSAPFYNNNMLVRPHISSGGASMSASNQVGCRQSHAPHLQPFTPSTSMSSSPSQQPPYNSTTLPIPQLNNPAGGSFSGLQFTGLHLQPFTPSTSMSSSPSQQPPYNSTTLPIPQLSNPAGGSFSGLQFTGLPVNHGAGANSSLLIDSVMNEFDNFGLSSVGSGSSNNLLPPVQTLDLSDLLGGLNGVLHQHHLPGGCSPSDDE